MSDIPENPESNAATPAPKPEGGAAIPWHQRLRMASRAAWAREDQLFLLVAVIIGLFSGLSSSLPSQAIAVLPRGSLR